MARTGRPPVERVALQCANCGATLHRRVTDVERSTTNRFFCNRECANEAGAKPRRGQEVECSICERSFYVLPGSKKRICSKECRSKSYKQHRLKLTCPVCGKEFSLTKAAAAGRGAEPSCSRACDLIRRTKNGIGREHNGRPVIKWSTGYLFLYEPDHPASFRNGWLAEHRWVMEQHLGRQLTTEEHVHHINGVKDDNRIENLVVLGHSEHSRITQAERKEQHAADAAELAEYRRRYGPLT